MLRRFSRSGRSASTTKPAAKGSVRGRPGAAPDPDLEASLRVGELLGEGVLVQDENGVVVWFNAAACRVLNASPEALLGRKPDTTWDLVDADGNAISADDLPGPRALRTRQAVQNEVVGVRHGGNDLVWMSVNSALSTNAGEPVAITVFRDITIEMQSQRELDRTVLEINRTLVQKDLPKSDRVGFSMRTQSVRQAPTINGGLCGAYQFDPTRFGFFIGNVRSQEKRAAGMSAAARHTLRSAGVLLDDPGRVLAHLHQTISNDWPETQISALYGYVDTTDGGASVRVASSGHQLPLLIREGTTSFGSMAGPPIGSVDFQPGSVTSFDVRGGDRLVMSTTDLVDGSAREPVVPDEFTTLDASTSTDDVTEIACDLAARACTENEIDDDFTVLVVEFI